jgi:hypothetical protein
VSAFHAVMEYAREHLPGIAADIAYDTSKNLRNRTSAMNAAAELMRRINYVPDGASLSESRGHWRSRLQGTHMRDPKIAAREYKTFAADMNDDMVNSLQHALECRVAPARQGMDDDGWKERPANPRPAEKVRRSSDEEIDVIVGRLLEKTPLNDENWGAW